MNINTDTEVTTIETTTITIDNNDIRKFLKKEGKDIPTGAKIYIMVPSGGDYSGDDLDIDSDSPIIVKYFKETHTDK